MAIYKIVTQDQWRKLRSTGKFDGAQVDLDDGFIHFSTAEQLRETAARHFAGQDGLALISVDAGSLGDTLKWEVSRGGALFPHLYDTLRLDAVTGHCDLPLGHSGLHVFPPDIPE